MNEKKSLVSVYICAAAACLGVIAAGRAEGQSAQTCTVTIQNITRSIGADGTFAVPNVRIDRILHRAYVRCPQGAGPDQSGRSGLLNLVTNGVTEVGTIDVGAPSSTPASLLVTPTQATIAPGGGTVPLVVRCVFPGGSTEPCTGADAGTTYIASNLVTCSVNAAGLVTAGASGSCIVTVANQGVIAAAVVTVSSETDADGDGIADDIEAQHACLDSSVDDAESDPDSDELTNAQEVQAGSDPCAGDTDGDGLGDGQEALRATNPTAPDSDFDTLLDGEEIIRGTNPLARHSDAGCVPDGIEVRLGLNPLNTGDDNVDSDFDGLLNCDELEIFTDPGNPDTDGDGLDDGEEVLGGTDPRVPDTTPPTVAWLQPAADSSFIEGETITLFANATDDGRVTEVDFFVNGLLVDTDSGSNPFNVDALVPSGVSEAALLARARDTNGNTAQAGVTISITPDPGTTVVGRVQDQADNPIEGATVACLGISAETLADGMFSIPGVASVRGEFICTATFVTDQGVTLTGTSELFEPVRGGTTNIGTITISIEQQDAALLTSDPFLIPAGFTTLRFDYNFLSNEFPSFVGGEFDDTAFALVVGTAGEQAGTRLPRFLSSVNVSNFFSAEGSGFNGQTGFQKAVFDVSIFAGTGTLVSVVLSVRDVGDDAVDSAVVFDTIELVDPITGAQQAISNGNFDSGSFDGFAPSFFNVSQPLAGIINGLGRDIDNEPTGVVPGPEDVDYNRDGQFNAAVNPPSGGFMGFLATGPQAVSVISVPPSVLVGP